MEHVALAFLHEFVGPARNIGHSHSLWVWQALRGTRGNRVSLGFCGPLRHLGAPAFLGGLVALRDRMAHACVHLFASI